MTYIGVLGTLEDLRHSRDIGDWCAKTALFCCCELYVEVTLRALVTVAHGLLVGCSSPVPIPPCFAISVGLVARVSGELVLGDHVERLVQRIVVVVLYHHEDMAGRIVAVVD
jgi:hypothetical protein